MLDVAGTVFYLAPELALGQRFDGRADLYALGVMLYEWTTGCLPFEADDPLAVISQHLHAPVVPPRARNPEIPPGFDALMVQLLSKDPQDRPGTATMVLQTLNSAGLLDREAVPGQELSLLERIERGRLVGREREMAEARALWSRVLGGDGQLLLVSGEAGVGKTRLVRELATHVRVLGSRVYVPLLRRGGRALCTVRSDPRSGSGRQCRRRAGSPRFCAGRPPHPRPHPAAGLPTDRARAQT